MPWFATIAFVVMYLAKVYIYTFRMVFDFVVVFHFRLCVSNRHFCYSRYSLFYNPAKGKMSLNIVIDKII